MERFEYIELTIASDKMDDDEQRFKVFGINPFSMESFDACNMLEIWLESKVLR